MKRDARWEIGGIALLVAVVALARTRLPARVELGEVVLGMAALLLLQGLVRDVARLRASRASGGGSTPRITCVCAESTLGASAIVIGVLLLFVTSPVVLSVSPVMWPAGAALVTVFGFVTRHLVLDWRTRRLRWEPNHAGIVVWKK